MKSLWLNIIWVLSMGPASAQVFPDLRFTHLTEKDGLSNNSVSSITQDEEGILWFGTENGLNRYDGYGLTKFYANPDDPYAIPLNQILQLIPDWKNNLWASTPEGIFRFNTTSHRASVFRSDPADPRTFRKPHEPYVYLDSSQLPWVTTEDGLYHFTDSLHYERRKEGIDAYPGIGKDKLNVYGALVRDKTGQLWSSHTNMIFLVDKATKVTHHVYQAPLHLSITSVFFDSDNRCWVTTWENGIYLFDPIKNTWQSFNPTQTGTIVFGGAEWEIGGQKFMVFTISPSNLYFVNERDLTTHAYIFPETNMALTAQPYVDRQNILWVPTSNGVYYTTPSNNLFNVIPIVATGTQPKATTLVFVYNMREDSSGYWLSKRAYGGLFWYDKNWKLVKSWPVLPVAAPGRFPVMGTISKEAFDFRQRGSDMYVTTEGGLSVLNLHDLRWDIYTPTDLKSPPRLRTIVVVNDHTWWIRSFDQGVFVFNPITRQFLQHYRNDDTCLYCLPSEINYLFRDQEHRIWATTNQGLYQYESLTDHFRHIPLQGKIMPSNALFGMVEDADGLIWIGAQNGLFTCNPDNGTVEQKFPGNNDIGRVFRLCLDDEQNIWFNSNTGYWCWLRKPDKVVHFEYGLGLPETDECIVYKTSDGSIYGGGQDAVIRFSPLRLMNYKVTAETRIMEAIVNDTLAPFSRSNDGQKQLVLSPKENSLHINFDVINYDLISTNQFFYKLSPGDNGWKQSETGHLSFYNLQPGTYHLDVEGASRLTGNFTNSDSLDIIVRPYWYLSDWFKAFCLLISCLLVLYIVRYRITIVRKEGAFKQKITEVEMTALRTQMNPHFIFNSLNSIENFIMQNEKRLASDYLNKFATLIRMILENSRSQTVPLTRDMEAMQLYVDLERLRFNNKFCYLTDIDKILLSGDYKVAPLLIQPFAENAIIHGLAPSENENLYLKISIRLQDEYMHYTIEDNGIGRSAAMGYAHKKGKAGHKSLGLRISRERIAIINRLHGADGTLDIIDVHNEDGKPIGTRVLLTIKIA